jgi:CheY-like chemotaxis protein
VVARAEEPSAEPRLAGVHVLLVEDDADMREAMRLCLELEGASVASAEDGTDGLEAFGRAAPDVVVSDLWMPRGNGFDLIADIRRRLPEEGGLAPAIAISAAENMRKALMAGFQVFLGKPFEPFALIETIAEITRADHAQAVAPWTLAPLRPETLLLTLVGRIEGGDMRGLGAALAVHLDAGPVDVVADLRRIGTFSVAAATVAERALWSRRSRVRSVRLVGGSPLARIASAAACKLLGIATTFSDDLEDDPRSQP